MSPSFSVNYTGNHRPRNSVSFGDFLLFSCRVFRAYFPYCFLTQFRKISSPLSVHIGNVFNRRSKEKMPRIHTRRVIAFVENTKTSINRPVIQNVRSPMSIHLKSSEFKNTVSVWIFLCPPVPTSKSHTRSLEESSLVIFRPLDLIKGFCSVSFRFIHKNAMTGFSHFRCWFTGDGDSFIHIPLKEGN